VHDSATFKNHTYRIELNGAVEKPKYSDSGSVQYVGMERPIFDNHYSAAVVALLLLVSWRLALD
jgi:hypothetical protein